MKLLKLVGVLVTLAGAGVLALVLAPSAFGHFDSHLLAQGGQEHPDRRASDLMVLAGRGAEIGVRISEAKAGGVVIEEVQPDSPAEKAGLKRSDVIVEFDGERVRSARQFGRLVQETPPGRTVKATIMRDGQKKELQIAPTAGRGAGTLMDGDRLREQLGALGSLRDRVPFNFNFDFDLPGVMPGRRLGVTVDELTNQLAEYFGAKGGVLVTTVTDGSAAARAGLKAGDVITSVNGQQVRSRDDLVRALRDGDRGAGAPGDRNSDEVTLGIVRDKKESTVKATIEAPRRTLRGARPV
jgi:serine protease Do